MSLTLVCLSVVSYAQSGTRVLAIRPNNQINTAPYLAGEANSWNPHDLSSVMKFTGNCWALDLQKSWFGTVYKLTLGSWETVECAKDGADVSNRIMPESALFGNSTDTIWIRALYFKGSTPPKVVRSTASANVQVLAPLPSIKLGRNVVIRVWLPPNYDQNIQRWPVWYLQDGQNLFDDSLAFAGEWGVDELMEARYKAGKPIAIVVGIDQGKDRIVELSPFVHPKHGGGGGDDYLDFVTSEVKPMIDSKFRTHSSPQHTLIGGSSLGGLMAHWGLVRQDNVSKPTFGHALVFSAAIWFTPQVLGKLPATSKGNQRVFILAGGKEGSKVTEYADTLAMIYRAAQYKVKLVHDPAGNHNEAFWRKHLPTASDFLLGDKQLTQTKPQRPNKK